MCTCTICIRLVGHNALLCVLCTAAVCIIGHDKKRAFSKPSGLAFDKSPIHFRFFSLSLRHHYPHPGKIGRLLLKISLAWIFNEMHFCRMLQNDIKKVEKCWQPRQYDRQRCFIYSC